jgi:hypothetical protein
MMLPEGFCSAKVDIVIPIKAYLPLRIPLVNHLLTNIQNVHNDRRINLIRTVNQTNWE